MVSELLMTKIENISLKLQLLQTQGQAFLADQKVLIDQARVDEGAPDDWALNMDTRTFQALPVKD